MAAPLTELGPYGVPISIKLPLFLDGVPLRFIIDVGLITRFHNVTGRIAILDIDTNEISIMEEDTGEILLTVSAEGFPSLPNHHDGFINLLEEATSS